MYHTIACRVILGLPGLGIDPRRRPLSKASVTKSGLPELAQNCYAIDQT